MEKNQILEELNNNIQDLNKIENDISILQLAIYQKKVEELKNKKLDEIKVFFDQQLKLYNQKSEKYKDRIDKNINNYKSQLEQLINVYDNLFLNVFKIMQNTMNNQNIAIANIVTTKEKLNNEDINVEEINKIIIACAQKKLNYAVIIDECKARIKWCIDNVQIDINDVFIDNSSQLQVYKNNIFTKIQNAFYNILFGKKNFLKFMDNFENIYLKDIGKKNSEKIFNAVYTLNCILKQMELTKKQISIKYEQMTQI